MSLESYQENSSEAITLVVDRIVSNYANSISIATPHSDAIQLLSVLKFWYPGEHRSFTDQSERDDFWLTVAEVLPLIEEIAIERAKREGLSAKVAESLPAALFNLSCTLRALHSDGDGLGYF
jgi:hypothetical protein